MATPRSPSEGDALLAAVTDAMAALHERCYHRPPGSAKTRMMGEERTHAMFCWLSQMARGRRLMDDSEHEAMP